ncbi:MAG: alpha/beta fold hydrolase [Deltaproteobacteria bacterium]|nr:alpha/beta fold hydrolase [Deltaproteobacteria bacterium]
MTQTKRTLPQCLAAPHGCLPGAEPHHHRGRDTAGVLLLHGLTGSPAELAALSQPLREAGMSLAIPVLAGHATQVEALAATNWRDWRASAQAALDWLNGHCTTVHIVGFSMGSLLATLLAAEQEPARRGKVVLLAPAFALRPVERTAILAFQRLGWQPILRARPAVVPGPRYDAMPLRSVAQLLELQEFVADRVQPLAQPVLVVHGDRDSTIQAGRALRAVRQVLGSEPRLRLVRDGEHLLLLGPQSATIASEIMEFLAS